MGASIDMFDRKIELVRPKRAFTLEETSHIVNWLDYKRAVSRVMRDIRANTGLEYGDYQRGYDAAIEDAYTMVVNAISETENGVSSDESGQVLAPEPHEGGDFVFPVVKSQVKS